MKSSRKSHKFLDLTSNHTSNQRHLCQGKSPTTLSTKQMKRSKPINTSLMRNIEPLTENQEKLWEEYAKGQNLIAYGVLVQVRHSAWCTMH